MAALRAGAASEILFRCSRGGWISCLAGPAFLPPLRLEEGVALNRLPSHQQRGHFLGRLPEVVHRSAVLRIILWMSISPALP